MTSLSRLDERAAPADPLALFRDWYTAALAEVDEADAMALATSDAEGRPSVRMVLLRDVDARGFVFFTHFASRKGRELAVNPHAALCFHWGSLDRQVRIEGPVAQIADAESDAYWAMRPIFSRLSASISPQSEVIASREWLESRVREAAAEHRHHAILRPSTWGGYRVAPEVVEFWQAGLHRLHDRVRYRREAGAWRIERLAP
jgi:pyridoxamine 5'-phosphate oxidase